MLPFVEAAMLQQILCAKVEIRYIQNQNKVCRPAATFLTQTRFSTVEESPRSSYQKA
jgi:hypothetical protein